MVHLEYPVQMEIAGATAMWTRPDTGDSPVSYPAPTYSAAKGIFESILWGPAVEIIPIKVEICAPVRYHDYKTNYGGPKRSPDNIKSGSNYQLSATVLIDVCYRLYAVVKPNQRKDALTRCALDWDRKTSSPGHAYQEIFNRRIQRGQSYGSVCLGWKEFTASYFGPFRAETSVDTTVDDILIPSMLRETFSKGCKTDFVPTFDTDIVIHKGTLWFRRGGASDDQ